MILKLLAINFGTIPFAMAMNHHHHPNHIATTTNICIGATLGAAITALNIARPNEILSSIGWFTGLLGTANITALIHRHIDFNYVHENTWRNIIYISITMFTTATLLAYSLDHPNFVLISMILDSTVTSPSFMIFYDTIMHSSAFVNFRLRQLRNTIPEYKINPHYTKFQQANFNTYSNSEALELNQEWEKRLETHAFLNHCGNNPIDSTPPTFTKTYIIKNEALASAIGREPNALITESDFIPIANLYEQVMDAIEDPNKIEIQNDHLNPQFNSRTLDPPKKDYINHLKKIISQEIEKLNRQKGQTTLLNGKKYFTNEFGYDGFGYLNINNSDRDKEEFAALLQQIKTNNEANFLQHLIRLATTFDSEHIAAKMGFIDVMTHLFVTKQFPSEGLYTTYAHFILRCGQIH